MQSSENGIDWRGPAVHARKSSLLRKLAELFVPPRGYRVLPTSSGLLMIFIGMVMGLAAYNTENNIIFASLSLLLGTLIVSGVICWANMRCARWRLETNTTFRVGDDGRAVVEVQNSSRRLPLLCLQFALQCDAFEFPKRLYLREHLEPGERRRLNWDFRPTRRMRARIVLSEVVSTFPFGFLSKHVAGECEAEIKVWPARIKYSSNRNAIAGLGWQGRSSSRKGNSGELLGLRNYERGDAPHSIHWKVSARRGQLVVKQNAAETQCLYHLVLDTSQYYWSEAALFEKLCSFAASLAEDLFLSGNLEYCTILGSGTIRVMRVPDLESFFDALSEAAPLKEPARSSLTTSGNHILFKPMDADSIGAFVNGVAIAQT